MKKRAEVDRAMFKGFARALMSKIEDDEAEYGVEVLQALRGKIPERTPAAELARHGGTRHETGAKGG